MRVVFIHRGGAEMASYRYRAEIPAKAMGASVNAGMADILVFSKPMPGDLELAKEAKKDGTKVIVDFCDDHFAVGSFYDEMAALADRITCPSEAMREVIKAKGYDAELINDPYEFGLQKPHADGNDCLWFGHQSNLGEILPWVQRGTKVRVVTGPNKVLENYVPWSLEGMGQELAKANIVMLPDGKGTRSNNRMVNAIAAGCFVVAGHQYDQYKKMIFAGKIHHGLQFCNAFVDELNDMVEDAQLWAYKNHSPAVIGKQWEQVCESI